MSTTVALAIGCGILGVVIGSFLTVLTTRLTQGKSLVPRSRCPRCESQIRWFDNIPVVSFAILRGRCRDCRAPIAWTYPALELGTGLLFALVAAVIGPRPDLPAYLWLAGVGMAVSVIDARERRIPSVIVLPSYGVVAVLLALASGITGDWTALVRAAIGGAGLFAAYFAIAALVPKGMGMGDVKLAGLLGMGLAYLGWGPFAVGSLAAFAVGAAVGVGVMLARHGGRKTAIPFGPWMCVGAALGIAIGAPVWKAYLGLMGM
jgi:leader peptidase (prepilin peptidase)/N-methyltransferase